MKTIARQLKSRADSVVVSIALTALTASAVWAGTQLSISQPVLF